MSSLRTDPQHIAAHWIARLGPFSHGPRFLPHVLAADPHDVATAVAECRVRQGGTHPLDVLALGALILVVSRYNGGEPCVVARPSGERVESLTFCVSTGWNEDDTARAFVERVRLEIERAQALESCPVDLVAPGLGLSHTDWTRTFLQLACICHHVGGTPAALGPAGVLLRVNMDGLDVRLELEAKGSACAPAMVPAMVRHVARALEWLTEAGDAPLHSFELLSEDERVRIVRDFNDTAVPLPAGLTVHGLIAAQAASTPDATAVIHGDHALTYRQLDGQANHLAAVLQRDFGVTPGARVGVMLERSEKAIVALCAIMKAGAAYVPINPRHPWETARYMIDNAGISVLIVDSESIAAASNFAGGLLVVDLELRHSPVAGPLAESTADTALAYVIYTSGSTGRPKGVGVEHRAVVNTILWRNAFYGIGPADINLQIPSFAFDSSVVDIFCVLTVGGTLVVPHEDMRLDARRLLALSAAHGVTSCIVTPSYYKLLLGELAGAVPSLRSVTLAGESAMPELVAAHLETLPGVRLFNEYGPTENAVCSTACLIDVAEPTVSIGRPIWNVTVLLLDALGRLVPIGVPGEIFVGGAGLARGYLNQEALTDERFVASPVPAIHAGRLYRTGDRACWRPDGSLEFLGRLDGQVKIRGVRIELDEVEHALRQHPDVTGAAVVCKTDAGGAKYLSAYAETSVPLTRAALREHMSGLLAGYMVPDAFSVLPQLPLNLNGKVDRVALAALEDQSDQPVAAHAPLSPVQSRLMALWADVLKRSQVDMDDNFFALGGNSLRVMELTSRIRGEMARDVELLDVYTYPTVRELADRLDRTPS